MNDLLSLQRKRKNMKMYMLLNNDFSIEPKKSVKSVFRWIEKNKIDLVSSGLFFDYEQDILIQEQNFKEYMKVMALKLGKQKHLIFFKVYNEAKDESMKQNFEKLFLQCAISLYEEGLNIVHLDFRLDSISENLQQDWSALQREIESRNNTYKGVLKLREGTINFSLAIAKEFISCFPDVNSQLTFSDGIYENMEKTNWQKILIRIVSNVKFRGTVFFDKKQGDAWYLQLETLFENVRNDLLTSVKHSDLQTLEFFVLNQNRVHREYSAFEKNTMFKAIKCVLPSFKQLHTVKINNTNIKKINGGMELMNSSIEVEEDHTTQENALVPTALPIFEGVAGHIDCFISHEWGSEDEKFISHKIALNLKQKIESNGFIGWVDDYLRDFDEVNLAIDKADVILILLTERYFERCEDTNTTTCKEFKYAIKRKNPRMFVPIVLETKFLNPTEWFGRVGKELPTERLVDFTSEPARKKNLPKILEMIKEIKS